jgi:ketosteroid isomerase-like protein
MHAVVTIHKELNMKTSNLIFALLASVTLTGPASAQASGDVATMTDVLALEQTWLKSEQTNDVELLKPLLADTIVDTTTDGKLLTGKDAAIADAKAVRWSSAEYTEMRIAVYGSTAIATAVFTGQGTDGAGKAVSAHERFTDAWVKMPDGSWRCVATHGSTLAS